MSTLLHVLTPKGSPSTSANGGACTGSQSHSPGRQTRSSLSSGCACSMALAHEGFLLEQQGEVSVSPSQAHTKVALAPSSSSPLSSSPPVSLSSDEPATSCPLPQTSPLQTEVNASSFGSPKQRSSLSSPCRTDGTHRGRTHYHQRKQAARKPMPQGRKSIFRELDMDDPGPISPSLLPPRTCIPLTPEGCCAPISPPLSQYSRTTPATARTSSSSYASSASSSSCSSFSPSSAAAVAATTAPSHPTKALRTTLKKKNAPSGLLEVPPRCHGSCSSSSSSSSSGNGGSEGGKFASAPASPIEFLEKGLRRGFSLHVTSASFAVNNSDGIAEGASSARTSFTCSVRAETGVLGGFVGDRREAGKVVPSQARKKKSWLFSVPRSRLKTAVSAPLPMLRSLKG